MRSTSTVRVALVVAPPVAVGTVTGVVLLSRCFAAGNVPRVARPGSSYAGFADARFAGVRFADAGFTGERFASVRFAAGFGAGAEAGT